MTDPRWATRQDPFELGLLWPTERQLSSGSSVGPTGQGMGMTPSLAVEDIPEDEVCVSDMPYVWNSNLEMNL